MKILAIGLAVAWCVTPFAAMAEDDTSTELRAEAPQDRGDQHHRQHFLYDSEYQPGTDGAAARTDGVGPRAKDCTDERVRVSRGDGTTSVARIDKCR